MRIPIYLFVALAATLLLACSKGDPSPSGPSGNKHLEYLNYFEIVNCGSENEWTIDEAKKTLRGKWKQYQRVNTDAFPLDTI